MAERAREALAVSLLREEVALVCEKMPDVWSETHDRNAGSTIVMFSYGGKVGVTCL